MELRKATKQKTKLRIGIAGTSGSGKTYSALLLASGITSWNKIALIDTENGSGELYSDLGDYNIIVLQAPFTPEKYIEAIKLCETSGIEVIIIDSVTHEWEGEGGLLEVHSKMPGNSFTNWAKITPRHNKFLQSITSSKCHVITTVRKKQDYDMAKDGTGKTKVIKVGLKEIQREGFEYELTVNFELDIIHNATAGKDRTGLFMDKTEFIITNETGKTLLKWCNEGVEFLPKPKVQEAIRISKVLLKKPDDDWGKINYQSKLIEAFTRLSKKEKWTPEVLKKNYQALIGDRDVKGIDDKILIQYIQKIEEKINKN